LQKKEEDNNRKSKIQNIEEMTCMWRKPEQGNFSHEIKQGKRAVL
jgi:hypothetical protein